jgi:dihydropteroate synthase
MGVINVSPESFYKGSVRITDRTIAFAAKEMEKHGAHFIDIGAMSTAPYLETVVPVEKEILRIKNAIKVARKACDLAISADTPRAKVAEEAVAGGADAINDVTGLKHDPRMAAVVGAAGIAVIAGAYSRSRSTGRVSATLSALKESISLGRRNGIRESDIIIDPSIGFFRKDGKNPFFTKMTDKPWYSRDIEILSNLKKLASFRKPVCVSVSRKSFIGHLLNLRRAENRLVPSLICEVIAVLNGADMIRTHSVKESVQALTMLQLLSR